MLTFDKLVTNRMKCDIGGAIGGIFGGSSGSSDGGATEAAAAQNLGIQQMIDYMTERESVSRPIQEQGLRDYASAVRNPTSTQELMNRAMSGGMYESLLSGQEEAALRARSATGGLRSGGSIADVGSVQNQAQLQAYQNEVNRDQQLLSGLGSLAGMGDGYGSQIASSIGQMGTTTAQGITAANQNSAASSQAGFGNLMGLGQLGLGAYSSGMFSDDRLKDNVTHTGVENGINTYSWTWNEKANDLGLYGDGYGTLASEVEKIYPDAIFIKNGYKFVKYDMIGVKHG